MRRLLSIKTAVSIAITLSCIRLAQAETFLYDSVGNLQRAIHSDGKSSEYAYDESGNLSAAASSQPLIFGVGKNFLLTMGSGSGATISADASSLGGGTLSLNDNGTGGDATAGDGIYSGAGTVGSGIGQGVKLIDVTVNDGQGNTWNDYIAVTVQPTGNPAWWTASSTRILKAGAAEDNYAMATVGQLKLVATKAKAYLDGKLPANAQKTAVEAKLAEFAPDNGVAFTPAEIEDNYRPLNLGQLKATAKPFYNWLLSGGHDTRAKLIARGYPQNWPMTNPYPWDPATPVDQNYAPVTLGQLKLVFSFDLEE